MDCLSRVKNVDAPRDVATSAQQSLRRPTTVQVVQLREHLEKAGSWKKDIMRGLAPVRIGGCTLSMHLMYTIGNNVKGNKLPRFLDVSTNFLTCYSPNDG